MLYCLRQSVFGKGSVMKKNTVFTTSVATLTSVFLLMTMLSGCGRQKHAAETAAPVLPTATVSTAEPAETPEPEAETGRRDGERFEEHIILEGMEETVKYEHVRNDAIGFEMDYDYELFQRRSEADRECFVSCYDRPENPENYLEVSYSPQDAETVAAAIGEDLSNEYEISRNDSFMLDRAGRCIRIDASAEKGGLTMPDQLQMVYIIPAADGCRVATAHYTFESAEGFGRRFHYFMDSFSVIASQGESK